MAYPSDIRGSLQHWRDTLNTGNASTTQYPDNEYGLLQNIRDLLNTGSASTAQYPKDMNGLITNIRDLLNTGSASVAKYSSDKLGLWKAILDLSSLTSQSSIYDNISVLGRAGVASLPSPTVPMFASAASAVGFGDSITFGLQASDAAHQWLNIVATTLSAGTPLNQGISGTVLQDSDAGSGALTNNGRDRYASALLGANLKACAFIAYGFNDARYIGAPSTFNVAAYKVQLREVVNGLIAGGYARNRIVLLTPYYITDTGLNTGTTGFTGQTRAGFLAYSTAVQQIAIEQGLYYADVYTAMLNNGAGSLIYTDNIHPTDAGHAVIASAVTSCLGYTPPTFASLFINDTFTDTDGTLITAHAAETGMRYQAMLAAGSTGVPTISAGRLYSPNTVAIYQNCVAPPNSADYYVEAQLDFLSSIAGDSVGVCGRSDPGVNTLYFAQYSRTSGGFRLFKTVAGTSTQLGSTFSDTFASGSRVLRLTMSGTTISMQVDGVTRATVTDSAITARGFAGVRMGSAQTSTTGVQLAYLTASH